MSASVLPETPSRWQVLDLLRGVAVLGILIVNIWAFALPYVAYDNPAAYGDLRGGNFFAWAFAAVFAHEKFITLFSVLFGAGMALFRDKLMRQQQSAVAAHYRRMFGLLLFGLAHAYLLWFGDILAIYAVCGMLLYPLLRLRNAFLLMMALALLALEYTVLLSLTHQLQQLPADALASMQAGWQPEASVLQDEINAYRGSWRQQMTQRVPDAWDAELATLLFYGPRLAAQMLIGVLLFRSGWLLGQRSLQHYLRFGLVSAGLGLLLVLIGVQRLVASDFAYSASLLMGNYWNSIGSLLLAAGYAALLIAWSKRAQVDPLRRALQATGQLAFSNYLLTTVLCTSVFYGHGLGWFGEVERLGLLAVTVVVWLILLAFSVLWLRHFRFGPMEWCWRWFSYGRRPVASRS